MLSNTSLVHTSVVAMASGFLSLIAAGPDRVAVTHPVARAHPATPASPLRDGADGTATPPAFPVPWTVDDIIESGVQTESQVNVFAQWTSPGLEHDEFVQLLDEMGVADDDATRKEAIAIWEGHRARMGTLHATAARAIWDGVERLRAERDPDRWSREMMALSEAQGRRIADAIIASIDDVRQTLLQVVDLVPADAAAHARYVVARTVDAELRTNPMVEMPRGGGARADLAALVRRSSRGSADDAQAALRDPLVQFYTQTDDPRRELIRAMARSNALAHYIKVPDEERLRDARSRLESPRAAALLTQIHEATEAALSSFTSTLDPDSVARLRALIDAESSGRPGVPDAAFPDPGRGGVLCTLLAASPPDDLAKTPELLQLISDTSCAGIAAIDVELRALELADALDFVSWRTDPERLEARRSRRRALLEERVQLNAGLRETLEIALDPSAMRELTGRME